MTIELKYKPGQWAYLKHDPDQRKRMIVDYQATRAGVQYLLRSGSDETLHYENELRMNRDELMASASKPEEE